MLALKISNIKNFMNQLLKTDTFDHFLLQEAVITSAASFVVDGHLNKNFYTSTELEELGLSGYTILPFSMLRGSCFDLIKGKRTPDSFKFIFLLSPPNLEKTLSSLHSPFTVQDITGVFLNLKYQNQLLTLTTGVSYAVFSPDKSLEREWDILVMRFLKQNDISFEEL